jgi:hypothetical protein
MERLLTLDPAPRIAVIATGAGAGFLHALWAVPGISKVLVSANLPYAKEATVAEIGYASEHFVSVEAAVGLAHAAYAQASRAGAGRLVGMGITASVATTRAHRGQPRFVVAVMDGSRVLSRPCLLAHGTGAIARERDDLDVTRAAMGLLEGLLFGDTGEPSTEDSALSREVFFTTPVFLANGERDWAPETGDQLLFYPGAFDPLHEGHVGLHQAAVLASGRRAYFEVTSDQPHKEALSVQTMLTRAVLLRHACCNVFFSRGAPLYIDKARRYPGAHFVIGADALDRMLDPKWGPEIGPMLAEFESLRTRFWVGARDGRTMRQVLAARMPSEWTKELHEFERGKTDAPKLAGMSVFRELEGTWNISSTELREKTSSGQRAVARRLGG